MPQWALFQGITKILGSHVLVYFIYKEYDDEQNFDMMAHLQFSD